MHVVWEQGAPRPGWWASRLQGWGAQVGGGPALETREAVRSWRGETAGRRAGRARLGLGGWGAGLGVGGIGLLSGARSSRGELQAVFYLRQMRSSVS